jgi:hypothetical protein
VFIGVEGVWPTDTVIDTIAIVGFIVASGFILAAQSRRASRQFFSDRDL